MYCKLYAQFHLNIDTALCSFWPSLVTNLAKMVAHQAVTLPPVLKLGCHLYPAKQHSLCPMCSQVSDEDEGPMRVVRDYVRPTGAAPILRGQAYDPTKFAVSKCSHLHQ